MGFSRQEYWSGVPSPSPSPRLIIPYFLGKIFPSVLPSVPRIMSIFILADGDRNYFRPQVNTKYGHSNLFKSVLSSAFGRYFICICLSVLCRIFKRTIWRSLEFPFCAAFSSLVFFSVDLSRLCSPRFPTLSCIATAKSFQSCLTLCDPIDGSPPGSPIPGILQARTLEWVAISFSNA